LIDTIYAIVKTKLALVQSSEDSVKAGKQTNTNSLDAEKRECGIKLMRLKLSQSNLLERYLEGKLSKDAYQTQKAQTTTAIQEVTEQLSALEAQSENTTALMESHKPYFKQEALTRKMLQGLIKEIRVTSADELEISWKFEECYQELQKGDNDGSNI